MRKYLLGLAAAVSVASLSLAAAPAGAQRSSYEPGAYWDVAPIKIQDGQFEAYLDYVNGPWKKQQEWAKSKGYITDYYVLQNGYNRSDEPDLYLITVYAEVPSAAKEKKMNDEFIAMMAKDEHQLSTESGERVKMRELMGLMQLRQLNLKK